MSLEARCRLLEAFGEGDAQSGLRVINDAARSLPEASLDDLRTRLLSSLRPSSAVTHPAASELVALREHERGLRAAAQRGQERDTLYPCDLDAPTTCPHCSLETQHPLCILDNAMVCPRCDGRFDLPKD